MPKSAFSIDDHEYYDSLDVVLHHLSELELDQTYVYIAEAVRTDYISVIDEGTIETLLSSMIEIAQEDGLVHEDVTTIFGLELPDDYIDRIKRSINDCLMDMAGYPAMCKFINSRAISIEEAKEVFAREGDEWRS